MSSSNSNQKAYGTHSSGTSDMFGDVYTIADSPTNSGWSSMTWFPKKSSAFVAGSLES